MEINNTRISPRFDPTITEEKQNYFLNIINQLNESKNPVIEESDRDMMSNSKFSHYTSKSKSKPKKHPAENKSYNIIETVHLTKELKYIGNIENGKFHGFGRLLTNRGELIYEGDFVGGRYEGFGKLWNYINKTGTVLPGNDKVMVTTYMSLTKANFAKDLALGSMKNLFDVNFTEDSWDTYEGYFEGGAKHGTGVLKLEDGREFLGDFERGVACGYGLLKKGKKKLIGVWEDNKLIHFL